MWYCNGYWWKIHLMKDLFTVDIHTHILPKNIPSLSPPVSQVRWPSRVKFKVPTFHVSAVMFFCNLQHLCSNLLASDVSCVWHYLLGFQECIRYSVSCSFRIWGQNNPRKSTKVKKARKSHFQSQSSSLRLLINILIRSI